MGESFRRPLWAVLLASVLALATVGAACTVAPDGTVEPPVQPVFDWKAQASTLHVVDDNNDNFLCDGVDLNCDEPYLIHLGFRVQYGVPGSASTFVVEDRPNELTCPGAPPGGFLAQTDSCKSGESATITGPQGTVMFEDLKSSDLPNILFGQLPEIAGFITFAFEEDILTNGSPDMLLLRGILEDLLNDIIANGNIPTEGGGEGAADAILTDIIALFANLLSGPVITLLADVGLFDDFVGLTPTVIAGVSGGLASLLDLVELQSIELLNGHVFTTAAPSSFTSIYTAQDLEVPGLGNLTVGATDTRYDVDWMVGQV